MNVPLPGQNLTRTVPASTESIPDDAADNDAADIVARVTELIEKVDTIKAAGDSDDDLDAITAQTELLEHAHEVLTSALERLDRV